MSGALAPVGLPIASGLWQTLFVCAIADVPLLCVPEGLRSCTTLGRLRLINTGIRTLPEWLCKLTRLEEINFSRNPLGKAGVEEVERMLEPLEKLRLLRTVQLNECSLDALPKPLLALAGMFFFLYNISLLYIDVFLVNFQKCKF